MAQVVEIDTARVELFEPIARVDVSSQAAGIPTGEYEFTAGRRRSSSPKG
jgi:hypothetical protein